MCSVSGLLGMKKPIYTHYIGLLQGFSRCFSFDMCFLKGEKKIHVDPNE